MRAKEPRASQSAKNAKERKQQQKPQQDFLCVLCVFGGQIASIARMAHSYRKSACQLMRAPWSTGRSRAVLCTHPVAGWP